MRAHQVLCKQVWCVCLQTEGELDLLPKACELALGKVSSLNTAQQQLQWALTLLPHTRRSPATLLLVLLHGPTGLLLGMGNHFAWL